MAGQTQQVRLQPAPVYLASCAVALIAMAMVATAVLSGRRGRHPGGSARWPAVVLAGVAAVALGWGWAGWRASVRLADDLPAALEGEDLTLVGVVGSLPVERVDGLRFVFEVESARQGATTVQVPPRVLLGWYETPSSAGPSVPGAEPAQPAVRAGQRWRLPVRLKRPHGSVNPHGFDYELWLFEQGLRASGYVRSGSGERGPAWLGESAGYPVERWRQWVRDALHQRLGDSAAAGLLAALSIGDQAAIGRDDWEIFRTTGVAHLVAISGLHITMFAWLAGLLLRSLWRRQPGLLWRCPAGVAARWAACTAATVYAVLSGWGVPAQRTVYMLWVAALLRQGGLRWPWPAVLLAAASVVCLIEPWALWQPGFWLSFIAVAVLMADGAAAPPQPPADAPPLQQDAPRSAWQRISPLLQSPLRQALRAQGLATLVLAPLSMLLFQQTSVVGFVANLVAIPFVTLLITPLALLGTLLPALWSAGAWLVDLGMRFLETCAAWPWASWRAAAAPAWVWALALLGSVLLAAPLPKRVRALGLVLALPLFAPPIDRPAAGHFELLVADVGQGNAVLLRTAHHQLLYDAGPRYSRENDAGTRVLVPLLRSLGVERLDLMMLSHRDSDHVGGAPAVLRDMEVARLTSSLEPGHPLRAASVPHQPCEAGQRWTWDGVAFELLHPQPGDLARAAAGTAKPNSVSCVLRVAAAGRTVLLAGDIERDQETALLARQPERLRADVLLVPHHGSKTSSSGPWLDAVAPRWAVVQAGYRNRFGHPAPAVAARYAERGIDLVRTDRCGAWLWSTEQPVGRCERASNPHYWHTISALDAQP